MTLPTKKLSKDSLTFASRIVCHQQTKVLYNTFLISVIYFEENPDNYLQEMSTSTFVSMRASIQQI